MLAPSPMPAAAAVPAVRAEPRASLFAATDPTPPLATVPGADAEEEIVCPNCGERQSKRLLCRACATDMPMGIAAKLEAEQQARAEALQARQGRRGVSAGSGPAGSGSFAAAGTGTAWWALGFDGRMGRLVYASAGSILFAAMLLLFAFLIKRPSTGRLVMFTLGMLAVAFVSVRLTVLRCHDCNRSGWWSVLVLVPYAGVVVSLLLSLMPGSAAANDYGEPPEAGGWPLALGSMAVLVVSALVAGSALMKAVASGGLLPAVRPPDTAQQAEALSRLGSPARSTFLTEYARAPEHKAFAVSAGGAWGWKGGAGSEDEAVDGALASCAANRQSYTPECEPVNVDGQWLPGVQ